MKNQRMWILPPVLWVQVFALYLVLVGLIGVKKEYTEVTLIPRFERTSLTTSNGLSGSQSSYKKSVDKIALVVIDAMRVDFVSDVNMPFTANLLDRSLGCFFKTNVKSPTVTLPRIKAIVSGDISTYWDIVQNFNSKRITQDNFIWHATSDHRHKIVFYGDETWLNLFPEEFARAEGTSSFYVSDFTEVDDNVTRHLGQELNGKVNWDMLILHYLGLDHIGHVHGPKSELIPGKLLEMDVVVKRVYEYLSDLGGHSLIFVCGDHGMANIGGHGGNSYHETTTPLLIFSTEKFTNCSNNWRNLDEVPIVEQVDIAPSMSLLWGMTLPAASSGKMIWPVFDHLDINYQLFLANYNALQLSKFTDDFASELINLTQTYTNFISKESQDREEGLAILTKYHNLVTKLSKVASEQLGQQNLFQIASGIVLVCQSWLVLLTRTSKVVQCIKIFALIGATAWHYFEPTNGVNSFIIQVILVVIVAILFQTSSSELPLFCTGKNSQRLELANLFIPLFYFSSSFIEEEQYLCYYIWTTAIISLLFVPTKNLKMEISKSDLEPGGGDTDEKINFKYRLELTGFTQVVFLLVLHRLACAWNQTGQKWSHLEDLADLIKASNLLLPVVVLSVFAVCILRRKKSNVFFFIILFATCLRPLNVFGTLQIESYLPNLEHLIVYLTIFYLAVYGKCPLKLPTLCTNVFIIFAFVLQKQENIPVIALVLCQSEVFNQLAESVLKDQKFGHIARSHLVVLFVKAAFFYQGNSNSITTIDVNAGYVGLSYYNEAVVGLLIFTNTFCFPTLILLAELENLTQRSYKDTDISSLFNVLARSNTAAVLIFSIVVFLLRHHLFIWSVFAPKLLYAIGFTVYYAVIASIYVICQQLLLFI